MHSFKQFLCTQTTERHRNEDKYFTFTIFISILNIVNQHTSSTSTTIFIRNVAVSNYTWTCRHLSLKKNKTIEMPFPSDNQRLYQKKKRPKPIDQKRPRTCWFYSGIRHGNVVAVSEHFWSLEHCGGFVFITSDKSWTAMKTCSRQLQCDLLLWKWTYWTLAHLVWCVILTTQNWSQRRLWMFWGFFRMWIKNTWLLRRLRQQWRILHYSALAVDNILFSFITLLHL